MGSMPNLRQIIFRFKCGHHIKRLRQAGYYCGQLTGWTAELWIDLSMRPIIKRDNSALVVLMGHFHTFITYENV
jgi:hypothetical protein